MHVSLKHRQSQCKRSLCSIMLVRHCCICSGICKCRNASYEAASIADSVSSNPCTWHSGILEPIIALALPSVCTHAMSGQLVDGQQALTAWCGEQYRCDQHTACQTTAYCRACPLPAPVCSLPASPMGTSLWQRLAAMASTS